MIKISIFFCLLSLPLWASPSVVERSEVSFKYQSYADRVASPCTHSKADVGLHEWDVTCETETGKKTYFVHLVLSYYPRTTFGGSGYELMFWATETSIKPTRHDSMTQWIHLPNQGDTVSVLQSYLGVEDDMASLQLAIAL